LGTPDAAEHYNNVLGRIQSKYIVPPSSSKSTSNVFLPSRGDVHFFSDLRRVKDGQNPMPRTWISVENLVKQLASHDLSFLLDEQANYDELQTEYLLLAVFRHLSNTGKEDMPSCPIPDNFVSSLDVLSPSLELQAKNLYLELRKRPDNVDQLLTDPGRSMVHDLPEVSAMNEDEAVREVEHTTKEKKTAKKKRKRRKTEKTAPTNKKKFPVSKGIKKHGFVRPKVKGKGATSAILTDVEGFRVLLQKALALHSFIHFFDNVGNDKRNDLSLIDRAVKSYIKLFSEVVYRGDNTVDVETCKIHSHLHLTNDIRDYGHPMNWDHRTRLFHPSWSLLGHSSLVPLGCADEGWHR
jgi:hypothetical protein